MTKQQHLPNLQIDGPINCDFGKLECWSCQCKFDDDMYVYRGSILCGECRYVARTGKLPPRRPNTSVGGIIDDRDYHGGFGSHTQGQFQQYNCKSEKHAQVLRGIETERGD